MSDSKPPSGYVKTATIIAAVAILPLAACTGSEKKASSGDTVTRAAAGDLSSQGGARRLAGDQSAAIRQAISDSGARTSSCSSATGWAIRRSPSPAITPSAPAASSRASTPFR